VYLWRGRASGHYRRTFRERMGRRAPGLDRETRGCLWVHAVSVGEVVAARALVERLAVKMPGRKVVVSTTTAAGGAVAAQGLSADRLFVAPFDFPWAVASVLDALQPSAVVLMETELWPNLIRAARSRGIPVAVVNGRISTRSFPRYRRVAPLLKHVLEQVDLFLMQSDVHADRIRAIGAPFARVRVAGNLKYDALPDPVPPAGLAQQVGPGPLWVAGSTMAGEDEMVLRAFAVARRPHPALRLVLAPRRPERFEEVAGQCAAAGLRCARRSALGDAPWHEGDVLLLDTVGELARVYALATVVFVGGSLVPTGGHNVLEAAVAGRAVVVGPHMENFQEIADAFRIAGALVQVGGADALGPEIAALLSDDARRAAIGERARSLVVANRGGLDTTVRALAGLLA
jgi:3-deoxy-D-manno-octulosonic-acid transferase